MWISNLIGQLIPYPQENPLFSHIFSWKNSYTDFTLVIGVFVSVYSHEWLEYCKTNSMITALASASPRLDQLNTFWILFKVIGAVLWWNHNSIFKLHSTLGESHLRYFPSFISSRQHFEPIKIVSIITSLHSWTTNLNCTISIHIIINNKKMYVN